MAEAVSRRSVFPGGRVQSQAIRRELYCGKKRTLGQVFRQYLCFACQYYFTIAPCSFNNLTPMLYNFSS
jgi:hypothetical protein